MVNAPRNISVDTTLDSLDELMRDDAQKLINIMQRVSGCKPVIWNVGTIGFGTYHYKYKSGREGDCHVIGFYARKDKITIYLMDGTAPYLALLTKLGKHSTSKSCLYIRRLSDIDTGVLEQLLQKSYHYIRSLNKHMHRMNEESRRG